MSTQVTYLRAIHVLRQSEDIDMPAIMERVCMEIVGTEPGDFNWEVLDEPASEQEDEMEELDALLMSWEEAQPFKDKGKAKATVDVVKAEGSLESGKAKGGKRGQKRKAEVSVEEEKTVNPQEEGSNVRGKKVKMQSGGNMAGPAPRHENNDREYDFEAMGATVTPTVPRHHLPCDQCVRRGEECTAQNGVQGQACDGCRAKKSGCSNVVQGRMPPVRLTSNPPPKEPEPTSTTVTPAAEPNVKPARGTSKPKGVGKPKAKTTEAAKTSKAKTTDARESSKAKSTVVVGSSKPTPQAAFVLVPDPQTTVYANPKFSGPNAIEEKTKGETVVSSNGQTAIVRVTRAAQRKLEPSRKDETREGSVRPGHDGETPRECFPLSLNSYLRGQ